MENDNSLFLINLIAKCINFVLRMTALKHIANTYFMCSVFLHTAYQLCLVLHYFKFKPYAFCVTLQIKNGQEMILQSLLMQFILVKFE